MDDQGRAPGGGQAAQEPAQEPAREPAREPVRLEVAHGVATLTLARPEAMNALDVATKVSLLAAVEAVGADDDVRCVVLTGTGRAFSVGQDLREHMALLAAGDPEVFATVEEHYNPLVTALVGMPKPVVAAVNGVAAGAGASLALAADLRLVAASGGFNLAFAGVALSADTGASWTLPRLVGWGRARDLLLRPRTVGAAEALSIGLATEVVADDDLPARTAEVAAGLAAGPTGAYAALRSAVDFSAGHDLAASLAHEATLMASTGRGADHREAVEAFLARRAPRFTGR